MIGTFAVHRAVDLRAADLLNTTTFSGHFVLGGVVTRNANYCLPAPLDGAAAELIPPACGYLAMDGYPVAPRSNITSGMVGAEVVVWAHVRDGLAGQCPADLRLECGKAVVVESVLWPDGMIVPLESAGVPTSLDGERVYRPSDADLQTVSGSFLLGGLLVGHPAAGCPLASAAPVQPGPVDPREECQAYFVFRDAATSSGAAVRIPVRAGAVDDSVNGEVVRAHFEALPTEECLAASLGPCERSLVVDAIVWRGFTVATGNP